MTDQEPIFEYSYCKACNKHITRQVNAPKPNWFHTPSADGVEYRHIPVPQKTKCLNTR